MTIAWHYSNYYDLLEVSPNASSREIQDAFKRAKTTYSQDNPALYSMFSREEAQELMKLIDEAYEVLSNQHSRKAYDQQILLGPPTNVPGAPAVPEHTDPKFNIPEAEPTAFTEQSEESRWREAPPAFSEPAAGNVKIKLKPQPKAGMAQTPYSEYKIDSEFEKEVENCTQFDGPMLQKIRVYKNLSLDNMSAATRVSRTYLAALENMDLKTLPAPVFVRGFVNQVAKILNLEEKRVINSYMQALKEKLQAKR